MFSVIDRGNQIGVIILIWQPFFYLEFSFTDHTGIRLDSTDYSIDK